MFYAGFQTFIGYADVKSTPVYFYVQTNVHHSTVNTAIPFEVTRTNVGNAMNPSTGIFTAPRPGKYFFTYSGISNINDWSHIVLQLNGVLLGTAHSVSNTDTFSHHATLQLSQGDQIRLFLTHGSVYGDGNLFTSFVGILIEEDVF
jgi:hypothetical protein